ncbi:Sas10/Utp3/C1D family protein [Phlyctema vagabunda]|uniref:Sas10/Utp3/C1D family protein n=1 Tax=Phlyctema vagabunda TaxID=108571 RepID=A0ABR4PCS7_9HELO
MAVETSLPALLATLTQSLTSALDSTPDSKTVIPPKDGISLLDTKNELLLSYLQNLVFLIILKLRNRQQASEDQEEEDEDLEDAVVKKLVELRVYLEKGVRPLEGRLKYQIDKVLRAADDAARIATNNNASLKKVARPVDDDSDNSDESDAEAADAPELKASEIDDLQYRPNPAALMRPAAATEEVDFKRSSDDVYKPPRINPVTMPTTGPRDKDSRKPQKSATLDEFITTELSSAPLAEPSIGSTIVAGGRRSKSEKERKDEAERKEYEEKNYTRLPKESKKERAKKGGRKDAGYGGEEWRGLGEGIDRIDRLTQKRGGDNRNVLEKTRKRPVDDGPRGSGGQEGQSALKKIKTMDLGRRDRGRGKN